MSVDYAGGVCTHDQIRKRGQRISDESVRTYEKNGRELTTAGAQRKAHFEERERRVMTTIFLETICQCFRHVGESCSNHYLVVDEH